MANTGAPDYSRIKKLIIEYNLKTLEGIRQGDSYRGEQGILSIKPETAQSLGMNVIPDKDYLESKKLFEESGKALERVNKAMSYRGRFRSEDDQVREILEYYLEYLNKKDSARKKLSDHLSQLKRENDDRFNNKICGEIIDRLLTESFLKTNNRLRDGLAYFYNLCQGEKDNSFPLTSENVRFVNYVFNGLVKNASEADLKNFDLDLDNHRYNSSAEGVWKEVIKRDLADLIPVIESAVDKTAGKVYSVDPLLFVALMKRESAFKASAVSGVGAAGLTQIMPLTGKDLGLENIYMPEYFKEATMLITRERDLRKQARASLKKISVKSDISHAERAYDLMQRSLDLGKERKKLFNNYKKELLKKKTDDRLKPEKAIEYGLLYFAEQLKRQQGDISLALASYNAGPGRVKEYKGIPPFDETVGFRNMVLKYYYEYLKKVNKKGSSPN